MSMTNTEPKVMPEGRYSPAQAARLLGVSQRTVYHWEEAGRLVRSWNKFGGYFTGLSIIRAWKGL